MARALDDFAKEAEAVADEQHQIARDARRLHQRREEGRPWSDVLGGEDAGALLRLMLVVPSNAATTGRIEAIDFFEPVFQLVDVVQCFLHDL